MTTFTVKVKWDKTLLNVEVDTAQPAALFKAQLMSLTGVQIERQKVLYKGKQINDDDDLSQLGLKPGAPILLVGSAAEIPKQPTIAPKFLEDLTEQQKRAVGAEI
ncbi:MAG: putative ubiquitin carboxyl-terminal hydrolase, partial [Streblomastix strix]